MPATQCLVLGPRPNSTRTEADYNRLFNLSLDLLCIAGLDGYFRSINPSWTRVLGWSEAELLTRPMTDFIHPEDCERTLQARARLANGIPVRGFENRYRCKDGSYRWLSWESNIEPANFTVFGVARDITERRQLDHERLVLSKRESTGVLASGIAHDFNNLLAAILGNLELVGLCGALTEDQREYLRRADQAVQVAQSLTQQLSTFAEGSRPARLVTDLKDLLRQTLERAVADSPVYGECVLAPDLWLAEVDERQIRQVIHGLVLNAREAALSDGVVRLTAENQVLKSLPGTNLSSGRYLRIAVTDTGSGISPEVMSKIFDPYFSTKPRGVQKGMGLGLSIGRIMIQQHGGAIVAESSPGCGTTVTCYLPAAREKNETV